VGHEVGHALETPDENWIETHKIPPQFVNVVEDARIDEATLSWTCKDLLRWI
jgi:hypothetical protein